MATTIIIADEHEIIRAGIAELLRQTPNIQVIGQCSQGTELLEMVERLTPTVTIVGVPLRNFHISATTHQINQLSPATRVILLGEHETRVNPRSQPIDESGVAAYLSKSGKVKDMMEAIAAVVQSGRSFTSRGNEFSKKTSRPGRRRTPTQSLSRREQQILQLVASGKSSKEIAAYLRIGETTVKTHREHIMDKLGTRSIAGLTRKAVRLNLVTAD